jgi:hypothetical protein
MTRRTKQQYEEMYNELYSEEQQEFEKQLDVFVKESRQNSGKHGFAVACLAGMLVDMLGQFPREEQSERLKKLVSLLERLKARTRKMAGETGEGEAEAEGPRSASSGADPN